MAIGISLASLLPYSALFPRRAANWAKKAGYQFIQVLPFPLVNPFWSWPLPAPYVETAWNLSYARDPDPLTPITIRDRLLFPSHKKYLDKLWLLLTSPAVPHLIVHHWGEGELAQNRALLEVHPGLWVRPQKIRELISGNRLVLDLYHLRRKPSAREIALRPEGKKADESVLGGWREAIEVLLPATRLIHISPHRETDELSRFLAGEKTELEKMLRYIKARGFSGDYVVEFNLGLEALNLWELKRAMRVFRQRLKEIAGA